MSTLLVVNGAPYGNEACCRARGMAEDDLIEGVRLATVHDLAEAVARRRAHLSF